MSLRLNTALAFALVLAACTSETTPAPSGGGDPPAGQPASSEETTTDDSAPAGAVFSVSCNGDVSKASFDVGLQPKCIGGPPGSNCSGPTEEDCKAQDVKFHYAPPAAKCVGIDVYEWTGSECVAHNTHGEGGMLKCTGADCEKLFKSKEDCESLQNTCLANK